MSIQPLWLTHFIEILLVLEFQLTKFIVSAFSYKAHFRPQISSNGGKCDREFPECDYRYILKVDLKDVTGNIHGVISFDDAANQLMGISAKDLCLISTELTLISEIVNRICKKQLLLTLSIRTDTFSRNACLKVLIVMVENTSSATSLDTKIYKFAQPDT